MKHVTMVLMVAGVGFSLTPFAWGQGNPFCPASMGRRSSQPSASASRGSASNISTPSASRTAQPAATAQRPAGSINSGGSNNLPNIDTAGIAVSWNKVEEMCNHQLYVFIDDKVGLRDEVRREGNAIDLCHELDQAVQANQPIVLYISEDGNKEVERVEKMMLGDPEVVNTLNRFARIKIDIKKMKKEILEKYNITQAPTYIVMLPNFEIVHVTNKMASRAFQNVLEETLKKHEGSAGKKQEEVNPPQPQAQPQPQPPAQKP